MQGQGQKEALMSTTLTALDQRLRDSVMHQLAADPQVDASLIGVSAQEGIVTLSGYVNSYAEKLAAERSCRRVYGVRALANELEIRLSVIRIDPDIARDALAALKNRIDVPFGIAVTVRNGHLTLAGAVEWMYQKMAAERSVKSLRGVKGVFNQITLQALVVPQDVQQRITDALNRHADIDARGIHVDTEGNRVTLRGTVRSWMEKDEAQRAAWRVPGVTVVDNLINVAP